MQDIFRAAGLTQAELPGDARRDLTQRHQTLNARGGEAWMILGDLEVPDAAMFGRPLDRLPYLANGHVHSRDEPVDVRILLDHRGRLIDTKAAIPHSRRDPIGPLDLSSGLARLEGVLLAPVPIEVWPAAAPDGERMDRGRSGGCENPLGNRPWTTGAFFSRRR